MTRLNKRMAELGLSSRREADAWIAQGWVRVNGRPAVMGQTVTEDDRIDILPAAGKVKERQVTILLHKPIGFVSGQPEDGHQSADTLITAANRWTDDPDPRRFESAHARNLAPVGRLDIDSTGLLILTQDGRVARAIIGEETEVEKEYLVRVQFIADGARVSENVRAVFPADRLARLRHGLSLDGKPLKPARVDWQNPEQLRFILVEGKKRQIRRMCEQVGLAVVGLKRVRIGSILLGRLPVGRWRYLPPDETRP
ncbi:MAG TPA: pseudouridine synthase [Kiritimatiellia bacterium]|nr:pseudouridine synthase [Kiritimatiellia bacterium]HMP00193.1 pseudouridine synthase [Kiritimatiellia bacterium]HMP96723.1 pseudouridine synthase [Kiritimatiellia bacterium]